MRQRTISVSEEEVRKIKENLSASPDTSKQTAKEPAGEDDSKRFADVAQEEEGVGVPASNPSEPEDSEPTDAKAERVAADNAGGSRRTKRKRGRSGRLTLGAKKSEEPDNKTGRRHQNNNADIEENSGDKPVNESLEDQNLERVSRAGSSQQSQEDERVSEDGDLVGWLVSYDSNPNGESIEIRSGRCFIGRKRLRPSDIVVDDASISTPHCLVQSDAAQGISVQDLMSIEGTYVCRSQGRKYEEYADRVKVNHGDTIKVGSVEFLVCLVPFKVAS